MARFNVKIDLCRNEPAGRFWSALRDFCQDPGPAAHERLLKAARGYNEAALAPFTAPGQTGGLRPSFQVNGEEFGDRVRDVSLVLKQLDLAAPSVDDRVFLRSLGISPEPAPASEDRS